MPFGWRWPGALCALVRRRPAPAADNLAEAQARRLATATHELRTPVAGMVGMAGLLLETPLTPEQTTYAEAIKASGEALIALVDDMLDLAALDAGKGAAAPGIFPPEMLVEQVVELLAPRAHEKGLDIAGHVAAGVPPRLIGDVGRIRQILFNLAGNAVKYTESGGVGLRVRAVTGGIAFAVHDTGPGVPDRALPRLFRPFERGPAGAAVGTGLGLSIAGRLAAALGGRIEVDSAIGRGSTFVAILPLAAAPETGEPPLRLPAGHAVQIVSRAPFAAWMAERLRAAGAAAGEPADLAEARALLARRRPDHLVIDRGLGPEAAALAAAARAVGVRTVALVTPGEQRDLASLHREGFDHYLVKPVRARSLIALLSGAIAPAGPAAPEAAPRHRALLAEDDPVNALLARAQLARLGHEVEHVTDGALAVAAHARALDEGCPFGLVLLDLRLPELDGCAAAARMRAAEAARNAPAVAILAITANAGAREQHEALAAGMDGFLRKPLDRDALVAALAAAGRDAPIVMERPSRYVVANSV